MKELRDKGLCYFCDAKWGKGQNPKLYLLEDLLLEIEISELGGDGQGEKVKEPATLEVVVP